MIKIKREPRGKNMFNKTVTLPPTPEQISVFIPILGIITDNQAIIAVTTNSLPHRTERYED